MIIRGIKFSPLRHFPLASLAYHVWGKARQSRRYKHHRVMRLLRRSASRTQGTSYGRLTMNQKFLKASSG